MNSFNLYYWLYYIVYKFVKLTSKQQLLNVVPTTSADVFLIGLINYYISFMLYLRVLELFPNNVYLFLAILSIFPIFLFFLNKLLFLKNENYKKIENYFDKKNNFKRIHFILMSLTYLFASLVILVWVGTNYKN